MSSRVWAVLASLVASAIATLASTLHWSPTLQFTMSFMLMSGIVNAALVSNRNERRRLMQDVLTDPLTGAFNRRHFQLALRVASQRRERTLEPASLLVFDVDHFKAVNDTFGHATGDAVLKALVTIVAGRIRLMDVVCRIGGDEFAVLLSNAPVDDAVAVAEDLRSLAERLLLDGCRVSISGGVSELKPGQSTGAWLADADAALYHAKREGRNRIASASQASAAAVEREQRRAPFARDRRDASCEEYAAPLSTIGREP